MLLIRDILLVEVVRLDGLLAVGGAQERDKVFAEGG